MKQKIYEYIREHPGCRQREIASSLPVWLCSKDFLNALAEMEMADTIYCVSYQDSANMEYYLKWYVVD